MLDRRGFLQKAMLAAAALTIDPEKLLWEPGKKKIFIPEKGLLRGEHTIVNVDMAKLETRYFAARLSFTMPDTPETRKFLSLFEKHQKETEEKYGLKMKNVSVVNPTGAYIGIEYNEK